MVNKKPNGYWTQWENVERELRKAIEQNRGVFPSHPCLVKMGLGMLSLAIGYHGGYQIVRKRIGAIIVERPKNYWKDYRNVEAWLLETIKLNNGIFPSSLDLRRLKLSTLETAIDRYHGGMNEVRRKMGYQSKIKPNGYWKNLQHVIDTVSESISSVGKFPTVKELDNLFGYGIVKAIYKYHGGMEAVKERLEYIESGRLENIIDEYIGAEHG